MFELVSIAVGVAWPNHLAISAMPVSQFLTPEFVSLGSISTDASCAACTSAKTTA